MQSKASAASTVELLNSDEDDSDSSAAMIRKAKARSQLRSTPYALMTSSMGNDLNGGDGNSSQQEKKKSGGLLRKKNKKVNTYFK